MELMGCQNLAVPADVMHHVVRVESSFNPYAIGVVGGRLARQPANLSEALATARMLESRGYNFSVGLAQVNRYNLAKYGLASYERAFQACPNLQAGARILAECHGRSGRDWGKSFSCYYSGNFTTGFRHGYVQKVYASMRADAPGEADAIPVHARPKRRSEGSARPFPRTGADTVVSRRIAAPAPERAEPMPSMPVPPEAAPATPPISSAAGGRVVLQRSGAPPRMAAGEAAARADTPRTDDAASARDSAFVF